MSITFAGFRYFIVPIPGSLYTAPKDENARKQMLVDEVLRNQDFKTKSKIDFAIRAIRNDKNIYWGKLSKRITLNLSKKTENDFIENPEESWPASNFSINLEKQIFVIELNSEFGMPVHIVINKFEEFVNTKFSVLGFRFSFEPLVEKKEFWSIIENHSELYRVKFLMNSPNLFGANKKANESLKELRELYNNTNAAIILENQGGELRLPQDPIEDYRDYCDAGGGHWEIKVGEREKGLARKRVISSIQRALRIKTRFHMELSFEFFDRLISKFHLKVENLTDTEDSQEFIVVETTDEPDNQSKATPHEHHP